MIDHIDYRLFQNARLFYDYLLNSNMCTCTGAQIHGQYHSETYDVGAARVVVFGVPLWLDVKPPRVILQVSFQIFTCKGGG